MRAAAITRLAFAAAGAAVALAATRGQIVPAALTVAAAFVLAGEVRLATRLAFTLLPVLLFSALLWIFVGGFDPADPLAALARLVAPSAPFLNLVRALVGSCAVVLALGSAPDGEGVVMLRQLGLPLSAATIIASGGAMAASIGQGFARSITALRAQGTLGPGRWSRLRHLGTIVALTWSASLSETVQRAEGKWSANGFLANLDPTRPQRTAADVRGNIILVAATFALGLILVAVGR